MRRILTSFGPFPGCAENPSRLVATTSLERWSEAKKLGGIEHVALETAFSDCRERVEQWVDESVDLVIHLGVAMESMAFRLETTGRNVVGRAKTDNRGESVPSGVIEDDGPRALESRLPLRSMQQTLRAGGLPVELSSDAGDYVRNFVYYTTLAAIAQTGAPTQTLFLHIPPVAQNVHDAGVPLSVHLDVVSRVVSMATTLCRA